MDRTIRIWAGIFIMYRTWFTTVIYSFLSIPIFRRRILTIACCGTSTYKDEFFSFFVSVRYCTYIMEHHCRFGNADKNAYFPEMHWKWCNIFFTSRTIFMEQMDYIALYVFNFCMCCSFFHCILFFYLLYFHLQKSISIIFLKKKKE